MANEVTGSLNEGTIKDRHCAATMVLQRSKIEQRVLGTRAIPLLEARVWDALTTSLPSAGAADDLGLITGAFGTAPPTIETGDLKAAGSTTRRCRILVVLPEDYEAGQTVQLQIAAGMKTTVADVAATIDVEAFLLDNLGSIGADLVTSSSTTINNLTADNKHFTITATELVPGSVLDVRISVLLNDAATATAVIGCIANIWLLADLR